MIAARVAVVFVSFVSLFLFGAERVAAHAGFVSSSPHEGAILSTAPGVVTVEFSEPIDEDLSTATVVIPDGDEVGADIVGRSRIDVSLSTNATGVYRVEWTTVSLVDGHTLTGSFAFGVGVDPGGSTEGSTATSPRWADLVVAIFRWVEDAALLLAIGLLVLGHLGQRAPTIGWVRLPLKAALGAALFGGATVVLGEAVVAAGEVSADGVRTYLSNVPPGILRIARVGLEAFALVVAFRSRLLASVALVGAVVALAAAGHAAAVSPRWWGSAVQAAHLISAGAWAGGVAALALQRPPDGWRGEGAHTLLDRYTAVALPAFAVTVLTGSMRGIQETGSLAGLFGSAYGGVLVAKIVLVLAMLQLSVLAWRRIVIRPRSEALVVAFVVAAAALLSAFPLPPSRGVEADEAPRAAARDTGLPEAGKLTLGGNAGEHLVGVTVEGSGEGLRIFVLGFGGPTEDASTVVEVDIDDRAVPVAQCGPTCRSVEAAIHGGERVEVAVIGAGGGTARFVLPDPDAPSVDALLADVMARMEAVRSFRLVETLETGRTSILSTYLVEAPDEFAVTVRFADGTRSETIWIGDRRYMRSSPEDTWEIDVGVALNVPTYSWETFEPFIAARSLSPRRFGGQRVRVISFFGGDEQLPGWFRFWVDEDLRVIRASMDAPGHFMEQRYDRFGEPLSITAPNGP